jgi:hypothetical protein
VSLASLGFQAEIKENSRRQKAANSQKPCGAGLTALKRWQAWDQKAKETSWLVSFAFIGPTAILRGAPLLLFSEYSVSLW